VLPGKATTTTLSFDRSSQCFRLRVLRRLKGVFGCCGKTSRVEIATANQRRQTPRCYYLCHCKIYAPQTRSILFEVSSV